MAMNNVDDQPTAPPGAPASEKFSLDYVQGLRREAASYRTRLKEVEGSHAAELRSLKLDRAFDRSPALDGLDREYIRYRLEQEGRLKDLDVNAENFAETLKDRIGDYLGRHPETRATSTREVPTTSGIPAGGPGGPATDQLTRQQIRAMTPDQVAEAHAAGKTSWLLGRR